MKRKRRVRSPVGVGTITTAEARQVAEKVTIGRMASKASYDWDAYFHGNPLQKWWKRQITNKVIKMVGGCNPIADIAMGSSPLLKMLNGREKVGVDINSDKVAFMQEHDTTSEYLCSTAEDTGLQSEHYTAVLCLELLEHHPTPHEVLQELHRITKRGGKVIIATPDFASLRWNIIERLYGLLMKSGYHEEHGMKLTESAVVALCKVVGLEHVRTEKVMGADMVMEFRKVAS